MPIIPISPTPSFGDDDFPSVQGVTIYGAFRKLFKRLPATTLTQAEVEEVFNNEEASVS